MNTLRSLALTHTTTFNNTYDEATQIARAALMEGNGAVLRDYYTFEEYIARRGNFIIKLPAYKHLRNACWVVRKNDAHLVFDDENQQLTVKEVRRRELANEIEPLLPLPTTSNTQSIDNFRYCRPEGWPEWGEDKLEGGLGDEWYVKTPGGSEAFFTPASSPVEGGLVTIASQDAIPSITDHAEPLQLGARSPASSTRSHGLDVNRPASTDRATTLPGNTVSNNGQLVATQQDTNVQGIDRLTLSIDYRFKTPPTTSGYLSGFHTSHEEHNRQPKVPQAAMSSTPDDKVPPNPLIGMLATRSDSDPELKEVMGQFASGRGTPEQAQVFKKHIDELGAVIQSQRAEQAAEEQRRWAMHNAAVNQGRTTIANSMTPIHDQAQTAPAASPPGSSTLMTGLKPNWKELATKQPQATITTKSSLVAPESSPAKHKIFTPHPDVSSMSGYSIVAPVKNKDNTKNMGASALKAATPTPVKDKEVPKDKAEPVLKPATPIATMAAPPVPIMAAPKSAAPVVVKDAHPTPIVAAPAVPIISASKSAAPVAVKATHTTPIVAAPQSEPLPETPTELGVSSQKPYSPNKSVEPAPQRFKGTGGVAQPESLPETPMESVESAQKPDGPHESVEPAPKRQKVTHGVAQPEPLPETPKEALTSVQKSGTPLRSVEAAPESVEPAPSLQKGTRGVAQPVKKTPASRKKTPNAKNTPTPAPTTTDSPSTADTKHAQRIASVIAGTILPKSKVEAGAAATEHHALLLAAHNAHPGPNRRASTRLVQKATNPDLMPFFFSRPPTNKQGEQQDFIRCICGVQHDDGDNMVCCDTCDVWQHSACVLPGVVEAKVEKLGKWECTVCDPWGHREVLRVLRASAAASAT